MLGTQGKGSDVDTVLRLREQANTGGAEFRSVPPSQVRRSPWQPREEFAREPLQELAESIRTHGVLEPLLVRENAGGLELLAGERRLRAAELAGLDAVPVRVLNVPSDTAAAAITLTENLAREDLSAWEEARGVATLRDTLHTGGEPADVRSLAPLVGWSTGKVSERLQIAEGIPPAVLERSRVDVHAVNKLPKAALLHVSQAGNIAAKAELLRRYVLPEEAPPQRKAKRGRPAEPFTLRTPKTGRVTLQLRKPAAELEPEEARALRDKLAPIWEAIQARAEEDPATPPTR